MIETPIHDFLVQYCEKNFTRCHTPGHKGRISPHDITEIEGAVNIIAESERTAARLFGAKRTLYSCSGSTLAIQAMLSLIKISGGERIAAFRGTHRSFVSACALLDIDVEWVLSHEFLCKKNADAVFITSIDYYGNVSDIKRIAEACGKIPLLVDNAHGAYLTLLGRHPITQGAAMCADSAHKTLPALTGAAYLHISDERFISGAEAAINLFGTSSPSYLILESLDLCNKHIAESKTKAFRLVESLKHELIQLGYSVRESDPLRITLNAREYGYSGRELAAELRKNKTECEYADENCTVLLFSAVTSEADTKAVQAAFEKIKNKKPLEPVKYPLLKPEKAMSLREAVFAQDCAIVSTEAAVGKVCAEIIAPCPPGVPVIMPGEIINTEAVELLKGFGVNRIKITEVKKK
jgi:arginine/lysine/ornithine decarboxylase